jgi:hypothetical protein
MSQKADRLLKLAAVFERKAELESRAWVGLLLFALPLVSELIDQIKATGDISADVDRALSNLNEYKSSYGFGQYEPQFTQFMAACQALKESNAAIGNISGQPTDPSVLANIQKFVNAANTVQQLGYAIKGYLDAMKGGVGKVFDVVKEFKMNLGIDTAATAAADAIDALYKHVSMVMPKVQSIYSQIGQKVQQVQQQQGGAPTSGGTGTPQTQKAPAANQTEELANITF